MVWGFFYVSTEQNNCSGDDDDGLTVVLNDLRGLFHLYWCFNAMILIMHCNLLSFSSYLCILSTFSEKKRPTVIAYKFNFNQFEFKHVEFMKHVNQDRIWPFQITLAQPEFSAFKWT